MTDEELWEVNRGDWRIHDGAPNERFATMSFDGVIWLVAEITGRERTGAGWILAGVVLRPGDPVRDALVGEAAPHARTVGYVDTAELDRMSTAQRARSTPAVEGRALLLTWNPQRWPWANREEDIAATRAGRATRFSWATGSRTGGIGPGDRAFLLKQGDEPRGIVAAGTCRSRVFQDQHWDAQRPTDEANYVLVEWDTVLPDADILPHDVLLARIPDRGRWRPQGSGTVLAPQTADRLEELWAEHLSRPVPVKSAQRRGQGWRMDSEQRKKVEDAAQSRLERHFREDGWTVDDTRHGHPYDAIAVRGSDVRYLEAKGTETTGATVIVTRGEVRWASTTGLD